MRTSLYPTFDPLPLGLVAIKDYPSLKCTLVECSHDESHRVKRERRSHHMPGLIVDDMCSVCKVTDFTKPVKMMAVVPSSATLF